MNNTINNSITMSELENAFNQIGSAIYKPIVTNAQSITISPIEKMPINAKTLLTSLDKNLIVKMAGDDGYVSCRRTLMPDIVDVSVVGNNGEKRVVIVGFTDGSTEKAVLDAYDTFSLEQGISICITKKLFSEMVGHHHGSSIYNKVIDRAIKLYDKKLKAAEKKAEEDAANKKKYQKLIEKKRNRRIKRENSDRERQIEIQKEAYLRAMREFHTRPAK